jgi:hypothetical protein
MTITQTLLETADQQPCGCPACDDGIQPGHFACSQSPAVLLQLEKERYLTRYYNGTSWVWERTEKQSAAEQMQAGRSVSPAPAPQRRLSWRKYQWSLRARCCSTAATLADLRRAHVAAASLYGESVIDETRLAGYVKVRRNWDAQEVAQSLNNL